MFWLTPNPSFFFISLPRTPLLSVYLLFCFTLYLPGIKVEVQLREEADRSEDYSEDDRSPPAPRSNATKRAPSRSPGKADEKETSEKKSREKRRDSERGDEKDRSDQGKRIRT